MNKLMKEQINNILEFFYIYMLKIILKRRKQNNIENMFENENLSILTNAEIKNMKYIKCLLKKNIFVDLPFQADIVVVWNIKYFYDRYKIVFFTYIFKLPLVILEDGFIRSVDIGAKGAAGLSIIYDTKGIYFDPKANGMLDLLNSDWKITKDEKKYAKFLIQKIISNNISKYNLSKPSDMKIGTKRKKVLVIDQRKDDQSVVMSGGTQEIFNQMLKSAIEENQDSDIIIKTHPDANSKLFSGYYVDIDVKESNVYKLTENVNPISLLKYIDKVYVFSSQMGFEALMCGKNVICYGSPFYAGWGITEDRNLIKNCKKIRTIEEVFYISYIKFARYYNPETNSLDKLENVIDYLVKKVGWTDK